MRRREQAMQLVLHYSDFLHDNYHFHCHYHHHHHHHHHRYIAAAVSSIGPSLPLQSAPFCATCLSWEVASSEFVVVVVAVAWPLQAFVVAWALQVASSEFVADLAVVVVVIVLSLLASSESEFVVVVVVVAWPLQALRPLHLVRHCLLCLPLVLLQKDPTLPLLLESLDLLLSFFCFLVVDVSVLFSGPSSSSSCSAPLVSPLSLWRLLAAV
mmetsp:Transcript_44106/g.72898  ORF Transcript_44106/g.72898 Transcript_44106/m.72898 type:complete len:212 (+) Transcript_44106:239-874(+)